tara:strand:+ start:1375 stop:1680 length:306 start_codon:yes stop_codon:yes gene_type:complete
MMVGRRTKFGDFTDGRTKGGKAYKELHTNITFLGKIIKPFFFIFIKIPFIYFPKYLLITIKFLTKYLFLGAKFIFKKIPIVINYPLSKFRNRNINNNQKKQ